MGIRFDDMRKAGAISAIALRYCRCRGERGAWRKTEEWARREYRDCSPQTIKACIERAKKAVQLAGRIMDGDDDYTFDHKTEKKRQE